MSLTEESMDVLYKKYLKFIDILKVFCVTFDIFYLNLIYNKHTHHEGCNAMDL